LKLQEYPSWDETRFIGECPGNFVCLARCKADKWFIAAINSGKERIVDISLSFFREGNYTIDIYEDKPGEEMTNIRIRKESATSGKTLSLAIIANGEFCAIID